MQAPDNAGAPAAASTTAVGAAGALLGAPCSPAPDRALAHFGRASVLALRTTSRRRVFAPTLSVHPLLVSATQGRGAAPLPGGVGEALAVWAADGARVKGPELDWHLRRELSARLLGQATPPPGAVNTADAADRGGLLLAWTRPGPAETEDADHAWWAAARSAGGEVDVALACLIVITRWGWWTLPEGPARRWARLRDHGRPSRRP